MHCDDHPPESRRPTGAACERGFTLVEILVMLVIVAIIAVVAASGIRTTMIKSRARRGIYTITQAVNRARAEALKRHSSVGVIFQADPIVFEDWGGVGAPATDLNCQLDPGEDVITQLRVEEGLDFGAHPPDDMDPWDQVTVVVYGPDGSLAAVWGTSGALDQAGRLATYFEDVKGNRFRMRFNSLTGSMRAEMWTEAMDGSMKIWSPRREEWRWEVD